MVYKLRMVFTFLKGWKGNKKEEKEEEEEEKGEGRWRGEKGR